jgi:hypothetical protein
MCQLSNRISRRYENLSLYGLGAKRKTKPRKGSIYVHGKLLVHGANIKWVWGKPCWQHPAFSTLPVLEHDPLTPHIFTLPSHPV